MLPILPLHYVAIKEALIREAYRTGILTLEGVKRTIKLDEDKQTQIYDFFVRNTNNINNTETTTTTTKKDSSSIGIKRGVDMDLVATTATTLGETDETSEMKNKTTDEAAITVSTSGGGSSVSRSGSGKSLSNSSAASSVSARKKRRS